MGNVARCLLYNKKLCYIAHPNLPDGPKSQVLSSHFFKVVERLQKLCEVKIFQLQSMSNAIRCIDQRFAFKNSRFSSLAFIFNLNNPRTTVLHVKKLVPGGEIRRVICRFFEPLIRTYCLLVKVSSRESGCLGLIPVEC